ncbi:MAG: hybrid sensor histidine kinase/response regulator [Verrucomicrobiales bacterium]
MKTQFADYGILYVDDEVKSLKYFEAIFDHIAPVYVASSPEEGYRIFSEKHETIGLVLSDKKMPNESGLDFLQRIRELDPNPLRFLVTAYADLDVAVDALNEGLLYSYLSKPWDPGALEHRLVKAMRHFCLTQERERLIEEKAEALNHLMMADKAASIGILSSGLNHHLRNALTVLRTFYDMLPYQLREELDGEPKDPSFWGDYYGEVGGQINRMTSMLTNLADGTRNSAFSIEEGIDLAATMQRAGEIVLEGCPEVRFQVEATGEVPAVAGDRQKIGQMARLLFQEARSSLKDGGDIEIRVNAAGDASSVRITFIDSGPLIPESDLERLFDPFFVRSDKPEELGTNLMACYLTVFHHGGSIRAKRTSDDRNSVIITLPVKPTSAEAAVDPRLLLDKFDAAHDSGLGRSMALPA